MRKHAVEITCAARRLERALDAQDDERTELRAVVELATRYQRGPYLQTREVLAVLYAIRSMPRPRGRLHIAAHALVSSVRVALRSWDEQVPGLLEAVFDLSNRDDGYASTEAASLH